MLGVGFCVREHQVSFFLSSKMTIKSLSLGVVYLGEPFLFYLLKFVIGNGKNKAGFEVLYMVLGFV